MKKILSLVLCVAVFMVSFPCTVFSVDQIVEIGDFKYSISPDLEATVIGYNGSGNYVEYLPK